MRQRKANCVFKLDTFKKTYKYTNASCNIMLNHFEVGIPNEDPYIKA